MSRSSSNDHRKDQIEVRTAFGKPNKKDKEMKVMITWSTTSSYLGDQEIDETVGKLRPPLKKTETVPVA